MKKYWKRLLALAASASVMFTTTACSEIGHYITSGEDLQKAIDAANEKAEAKFQSEVDRSKKKVIKISSSRDLVKFKKRVEDGEVALGAVLTKDIDMSDVCGESIGNWEPIVQYAGTFDGDNHSIRNLYIHNPDSYAGLFGEVLEEARIENVTMEDFQITSDHVAGSLVGRCYGTIENCHSDGQLTATGKVSGGLCGIGEIMINCSNRGTVTGVETAVGGVAGEINGSIEKCWNEGIVESTGEYAGGVIGWLKEDINHGLLPVYATDCYNTGRVSAIKAGGVAGYAKVFVMNRCYNLGEVNALAWAGGIVALGTTERKAKVKPVIENCYNKGRIAAKNWTDPIAINSKIVTRQEASGIAAEMAGCIANCYNDGEVSVDARDKYSGFARGIGGALVVVNSYAHGSLSALEDSMKIGVSGRGKMSNFYLEGVENEEPGWPETFFTDGSLLSELQSFSLDSMEDNSYQLELSTWVEGDDGMPHFEWEEKGAVSAGTKAVSVAGSHTSEPAKEAAGPDVSQLAKAAADSDRSQPWKADGEAASAGVEGEPDREEEPPTPYILSESNTKYLSWEDVKELSKEELRIARNEIYARHGRRFQSQDLQEYFDGKDWYQGTVESSDFSERLLNDYEKKNVEILKKFEETAVSRLPDLPDLPDAPSKSVIDSYGFEEGYSTLSYRPKKGTVKDCGEYYQVDAIYYQRIEAPANLSPGDQVTLVFNGLTGETKTLVFRDDHFYPMEGNTHGFYYYYLPAPDGKSVILYQDSADRVDKPILEGKLYVRKDATKEIAISNLVEPVSTKILNQEIRYNGVYFDSKGYVTRLVCYGD